MSSYPDKLPILPFTRPVRGSITLPGSKSITNRALILAALGQGTTTLHGALFSRDTRIMVAALRALGFDVKTDEVALTITITGRGGEIPVREAKIDVGNAGTAARFLTAFVCLRPDGTYHFDGDEAMRRRPIGALLEALESQGAKANARTFPFTLKTAGLRGGNVELDASESSQMLSALLMVAPHARSPLTVRLKGEAGSKPFIAMTEAMVTQFAARPADYPIEGDASAGSYFLALPLVTDGRLTFTNYGGPLQGDVKFRDVVAAVGSTRRAVTQNFREFSDTFLTLAAIAPLLDGPTKISGIAHTRKQETDRVAGMARELKKLGQHVIESEDALEIHPRPLMPGIEIETYHDHRFAMSFGILGCHDLLKSGQPWLTIKDPGCCAKTFPAFFDLLAGLRTASH
ncbi:3-phosphoshikimate 1-carboxyvinyltransferase [Opitutus sp. GAS368]|uniref:3-phosphoshikimate 1-carboxyvinyltransferase n=1 Tax=Opitutus sp. GAS368 TaxID=1882749 RepID=UPI00087A300F|nr:3-phosphoshikimate 1-carboxyvinyltransferase [Opitutus sp. GAS368]SDR67891.1 3-phosphoshikimate 1-carboxyvinyltransferase [Opitutus sp. GAS368]